MTFLSGTVTTGVAFTALNDFGFGFTLLDTSRDSSVEFNVADTITLNIYPLPVNKLVGGEIYPDRTDFRSFFTITANTANTITVKTGSDMTLVASEGDTAKIQYVQELSGGYDGIADIDDTDYVLAYDTLTSPLIGMRGKNLGLVKLATPGVTATAVQKAGAAFGLSQNWEYRYEVPLNITDEQSVDEYINETLGRNDLVTVSWPSWIKVAREGGGTKIVTATGAIHGREARIAVNFEGYHKAAAGTDAILSNALGLPDAFEDKVINEEFLTPKGINFLKVVDGNVILWGDELPSIDTALRDKHAREYLSHTENVLLENYNFIIFALNNVATQNVLKSSFITYFTPEFAKGAIVGDNLLDAINLKIDSENNTPITRANGDLNASLELNIVNTVKRFIITIGKATGVTEIVA
jgi:hypothetical protein